MKTEHRHELKEHELRKLTGRAQQFFEKYGNQILLGLLAVVVVIVAATWWISRSSSKMAAGWQQLSVARTAEDYAAIADNYPGTEIAQWARLSEAERHVADAENMLFTDSAGRNSAAGKAEKIFETVLESTPLSDSMRERALYGLARTQEIANPEEAAKAYESLARDFPNSIYREDAEQRAKALREGNAKDFYAWFSGKTLKPSDIRGPRDFGLPAGHPPLGGTTGNGGLPDFLPPGFGAPDSAAGDAPANAELPDDAPAASPGEPKEPAPNDAAPGTPQSKDAETKDSEPKPE